MWNGAAVIPVEKGAMAGGGGGRHHQQSHKHNGQLKHQHQHQLRQRELESSNSSSSCFSDELLLAEENNFLGICTQELLARGSELLKRTRKGIERFGRCSSLIALLRSSVAVRAC